MKERVLLLFLALLSMIPVPTMGQSEYEAFEVDGLYYRYVDDGYGYHGGLIVCGIVPGYEGAVNIPYEIEIRREYEWGDYYYDRYDVNGIDNGAFAGSNITSISIPSSVEYIGGNAFKDCSKLNTVSVPNDFVYKDVSYANEVGEYVWWETDIGLEDTPWYQSQPDGMVYLGKVAYSWKGDYSRDVVIKNGTKRIANYCFTHEWGRWRMYTVTIPSSVVSIGSYAFQDCSSLSSVNIPDNVTCIGDYAFSGCYGLTSLSLPSNLIDLGRGAFSGCSGLSDVVIPDKVDILYLSSFSGCGLSSLAIGKGLKCVLRRNFSYWFEPRPWAWNYQTDSYEEGCYSDYVYEELQRWDEEVPDYDLTYLWEIESYNPQEEEFYEIEDCGYGIDVGKIIVAEGNTVFDSRDDCNALIQTSTNTLLVGSSSTVIPNSVTAIGYCAFKDCGITSINIPLNVTSIDYEAFRGSKLTSITIPASVTEMGVTTFANCHDLTTIILEGETISECAFACCDQLKYLTIGDNVAAIGDNAFYGCTGLTNLFIGGSLTSTGSSVFAKCTNLTSVTIGKFVMSIGSSMFSGCPNLINIYVDSGNSKYDSRNNCNAIIETTSNTLIAGCKNTIIPNSVTSIGNSAFYGCYGLTNVNIPNSVTSIGNSAFYGCYGLTNLTLGNSVTSIGDCAFGGCSGLTNLTLGNSVISIGHSAFYNTGIYNNAPNGVFYVDEWACGYKGSMPSNASIAIEEGTLGIADSAFGYEYNLKSVSIPNSIKYIGCSSFYSCIILTNVEIPNSVTSIGNSAFANCSSLTNVILPNSVKSIGKNAFYGCSRLTSVTVGMETPLSIEQYTFSNRGNATLYVPYGCMSAYMAAPFWKEFNQIVEMPKPVAVIKMANKNNVPRTAIGYSNEHGLDFTNVDELKAYIAMGYTNQGKVLLSRVKVVPPNTGLYITTTEPGCEVEVPYTDEGIFYVNMLHPLVERQTVMATETVDGESYTNFIVGQLSTGDMGFVEVSSPSQEVGPNKCYLRAPTRLYPNAGVRGIGVIFDEEATDIENNNSEPTTDNHYFDLQGRKVTSNQLNKGVYIVNGKRVFIK